jgi:hypothetical protein
MSQSRNPVPTGNAWKITKEDPATVPVPLPVIIVKVEGPYTERDRKLWTFLLHAVWDELGVKPIHELSATKINQVFRECGGDHNSKWIWDSANRLTRTMVEWRRTEGDKRYKGISSLFGAEVSDESKEEGILRFAFPPLLIPIIKEPRRFARLRVHFLMKLSGKYAVTLYELLEGVANKDNPVLIASVDELRQWLKVPEGTFSRFSNFNQKILQPAIKQINRDPWGAGFMVEAQPVKKGRTVDHILFTVYKTDDRARMESDLKDSNLPPLADPAKLSTIDYEQAREAAPGWDIYELERQWREWYTKIGKIPNKPGQAFIAFCRKKYRRQGRP